MTDYDDLTGRYHIGGRLGFRVSQIEIRLSNNTKDGQSGEEKIATHDYATRSRKGRMSPAPQSLT